MIDTPTNNFPTFNTILDNGNFLNSSTFSAGNLTVSNTSTFFAPLSTISFSVGKWYAEYTINSDSSTGLQVGIFTSVGGVGTKRVYYNNNGNKTVDGTISGYAATFTTGDVIGIAVDLTGNQVTFYKNNVSQGAIGYTFPSSPYAFVAAYNNPAGTNGFTANFGQGGQAGAPGVGGIYVGLQARKGRALLGSIPRRCEISARGLFGRTSRTDTDFGRVLEGGAIIIEANLLKVADVSENAPVVATEGVEGR